MKYISPGGWFSLEYPKTWSEFEDTENTFLFYNPNQWTGNFRISAYKDTSSDFASQCITDELKNNPTSTKINIGEWGCAYSTETFKEEGAWYTTHIWVTGKNDICFECSFTVAKGQERVMGEKIISSLQIRGPKEPKEIIPIRILEIGEINSAFEWTSTNIKKTLTKDFTSQEADIEKLQALIGSNKIQKDLNALIKIIGTGKKICGSVKSGESVCVCSGFCVTSKSGTFLAFKKLVFKIMGNSFRKFSELAVFSCFYAGIDRTISGSEHCISG